VDSGSQQPRRISLPAGLLAWLWPGLGHIHLGHRRRGRLIMFGVLFMVLCGLFVGGIDVVDARRDRLWFYAQVLCGPLAILTDFANQHLVDRLPENWQRDREWKSALRVTYYARAVADGAISPGDAREQLQRGGRSTRSERCSWPWPV
jgi:hypothetical protein